MSLDKVLGKNVSYVTPDKVDKTLLVAVPRKENRDLYSIDESKLPFVGKDIWHSYEFSTLCDNGLPAATVLKIVYAANSKSIVESKSLKLYLNSYNLTKMGASPNNAILNSCEKIATDLSELLGTYVSVNSFDWFDDFIYDGAMNFPKLEENVEFDQVFFDTYNEDPSLLRYIVADKLITQGWRSSLLRSNCKVTNQPDWADIFIYIRSKKVFTKEHLLQYIISFRNEAHLHEECTEMIYKRIYDHLDEGDHLLVGSLYTRRGGIDICPIRATNWNLLEDVFATLQNPMKLSYRTIRQ